jgi:thiol:disulfide interchange protein
MIKFNKILLLFTVLIFLSSSIFAQIFKPVKWTFKTKRISDNESELVFEAKIEKGWHLYSQFLPSDQGPVATTFNFERNSSYELLGKVKEGKAIKKYDQNFEIDVYYFKDQATFTQKVKVSSIKSFRVGGYVTFMVCDDQRCLPPEDVTFSFDVEGNKEQAKAEQAASEVSPVDQTNASKQELLPEKHDSNVVEQTKIEPAKTPVNLPEEQSGNKTLWAIFIGGFLSGFLALLTPCVFPMVPMTVSFFTKHSPNRARGISNALLYGFSIIAIYVSLGFIVPRLIGPDGLNAMSANPWFNLFFFFMLVFFAASFLGAFEITLPSKWVNRADSASDKGGLMGIFFMAFTLSLVSFSCTGPIVGTLLVEAFHGGILGPLIGMTGFSLALALPFGLFAAFPGWMNSLPKSGGWLNSVKVVLGLLELALAMKFLSNADFVWEWYIITREVFIAFWIVIFSLIGFYLLGKLYFSHDSAVSYVSVPRIFLAILSFTFVVYMLPGMWGAPLKLISAFPPPDFYSEGWKISAEGVGSQKIDDAAVIAGADPEHCPHDLSCFHDYDQALLYAKKVNKPLLIDFTGKACVNCRKMENNVWVDPVVMNMLRNDYVIVSLYVDDIKKLPENEQFVSKVTGNRISTYGNKWSEFETVRFKTNSQPLYVLMNHNDSMLAAPKAYDPEINNFIEFLRQGKAAFASGQ